MSSRPSLDEPEVHVSPPNTSTDDEAMLAAVAAKRAEKKRKAASLGEDDVAKLEKGIERTEKGGALAVLQAQSRRRTGSVSVQGEGGKARFLAKRGSAKRLLPRPPGPSAPPRPHSVAATPRHDEEQEAASSAAAEAGQRRRALLAVLHELEALELIEREEEPGGRVDNTVYHFKHAMLREVLEETLLPSEARQLHERIAIWLEQNPVLAGKDVGQQLAHHWQQAENLGKAVGYYAKAAETTLRQYQHRDAAFFLLRAIHLHELRQRAPTSTPDDAAAFAQSNLARWHRQLGESYYNIGDLDKAQRHLLIALELLHEPEPYGVPREERLPPFPPLTQYRLNADGSLGLGEKDRRRWQAQTQKAAQRVQQQPGDAQEAVRVLLVLGQVYYFHGARDLLSYVTLRALALAEHMGPTSAELRRSLTSCIITAHVRAQHDVARQYAELGAALFKEQWARRSWLAMGQGLAGTGHWERANALLEQARSEAESVGDARTEEECLLFLAMNRLVQGDLKGARAAAQGAHRSARLRGDLQLQALALAADATGAYYLGHARSFDEVMVQLDSFHAAGIRFELEAASRLLYHGLCALRWLRRGDSTRAVEEALQARALFEAQAQPALYFSFLGYYHALLVLVLVQRGRPEDAQAGKTPQSLKKFGAKLAKDLKLFDDFAAAFPVANACIGIVRGLYEQTLLKRKTRVLDEALESAHNLDLLYYKALIHQWIGLSMDIRDTQRDVQTKLQHRDTAMEIFIQLDVNESQLLW